MTQAEELERFHALLAQGMGGPFSIEGMCQVMDRIGGMASWPDGVARETASLGTVRCERFAAPGADATRAVLYFHAGGYSGGGAVSHGALAAHIAVAAGCPVYLAEYRLAPQAPFPAAADDALAAYRGLLAEGVAAERIAVAGDSAGGALAMLVPQRCRALGLAQPACVWAVSPWLDLTLSGASHPVKEGRDLLNTHDSLTALAAAYLGGHDPLDPLASPLFGSFEGFPPALIDIGSEELMLSDAVRAAERIGMAGGGVRLNVRAGMMHNLPWFRDHLSAAREAIAEAGAWIRLQLGRK